MIWPLFPFPASQWPGQARQAAQQRWPPLSPWRVGTKGQQPFKEEKNNLRVDAPIHTK